MPFRPDFWNANFKNGYKFVPKNTQRGIKFSNISDWIFLGLYRWLVCIMKHSMMCIVLKYCGHTPTSFYKTMDNIIVDKKKFGLKQDMQVKKDDLKCSFHTLRCLFYTYKNSKSCLIPLWLKILWPHCISNFYH